MLDPYLCLGCSFHWTMLRALKVVAMFVLGFTMTLSAEPSDVECVQDSVLAADGALDDHLSLLQTKVKEESAKKTKSAKKAKKTKKAKKAKSTEAVADAYAQYVATSREAGTCVVWGTSHVNVFDHAEDTWAEHLLSVIGKTSLSSDLDGNEVGDFWIVKSNYLKIQGRYNLDARSTLKEPVLRVLTVGGKLIEDNTLTIGTTGKILWNGDEVLDKEGSEFTVSKLLNARYTQHVALAQDPTQTTSGIEVGLPLGIDIVVNRHPHGLGARITMPAVPQDIGGQDGLCGNFNKKVDDDTAEIIQSRFDLRVRNDERLFRLPFSDSV